MSVGRFESTGEADDIARRCECLVTDPSVARLGVESGGRYTKKSCYLLPEWVEE